MFGQPGQMFGANFVDARIGKSDSVDHAAVELCDTRCARSVSALQAYRFGDEASQLLEIDQARQLTTVSGGARGKQNRILKLDPRGGDCERGRGHRYPRASTLGSLCPRDAE